MTVTVLSIFRKKVTVLGDENSRKKCDGDGDGDGDGDSDSVVLTSNGHPQNPDIKQLLRWQEVMVRRQAGAFMKVGRLWQGDDRLPITERRSKVFTT